MTKYREKQSRLKCEYLPVLEYSRRLEIPITQGGKFLEWDFLDMVDMFRFLQRSCVASIGVDMGNDILKLAQL